MKTEKKAIQLKPDQNCWMPTIKKYLSVASSAAGIILAAPLKLPNKLLIVARYVALAAGIIKATDMKADE
ncbi:hypothetical protein [Pedobacter mendelii]|uniref:Uncharacterized protein n=1 Tax=Pedobacter mendelii TaxID=1908240 RepID=A0ABQ2BM39_9SPHI|nr:hypothetical protein [Pedobacter mendelii]GGI28399.1 hypothetical protein GCM10008119_32450 [Pedobacter mendelii]